MGALWQWFTDGAHWAGENGIPARLVEHVVVSGWALLLALLVTLPLAIAAGHLGRGGAVLTAVGTVGRALPTYALIVTLALWDPVGVGATSVVLALALFAAPPLLVNTYVALRSVQPELKDAAAGMGMTGAQRLWQVELPTAFPLIFAGVRTTVVQVLATATFGALVGAGTLGQFVVEGQGNQDYIELYAGVVLVALLCLTVDQLLAFVSRRADRRAGRSTRVTVTTS